MWAVDVALLGPASIYSAGVVVRPMPKVEGVLSFGSESASATGFEDDITSSASITNTTFAIRGRYLPFGRHNLALEAGLAAGAIAVDGSAEDTSGNSVTYKREAVVPAMFGGLGYALRTDMGFRLNVLMGWVKYVGSMGDSTVETTGAFSDEDRAQAKTTLDDVSDGMVEGRLYLELGIGWAF